MDTLINSEFIEIGLDQMIEELGESDTKEKLSSFSCPQNIEVENFLKYKAILFSKKKISKTYLIYWRVDDNEFGRAQRELVGYYAIALKTITIAKESLSVGQNRRWKELCNFVKPDISKNTCTMPAYLIGQLGKNYDKNNDILIKGDELLEMAQRKISVIQNSVGGKITYLECEDVEKVKNFYKRNGFVECGKRMLDGDETDIKGNYLIQLYKYK